MHTSFHQNAEYKDKLTTDFDVDNLYYFKSKFAFLRNYYINHWVKYYPQFMKSAESQKNHNMQWYAIMVGGAYFDD